MGFGVEKLNVVCHARRRARCTGRSFSLLCGHPWSVSADLPDDNERLDLTGNFQWYLFGFKM